MSDVCYDITYIYLFVIFLTDGTSSRVNLCEIKR